MHEIILKILRNRMNNLKQIITRSQSIIFNIRNNGSINSQYNIKEKEIVTEFSKKVNKFDIKGITEGTNDTLFKHSKHIVTKMSIDYDILNTLNKKDLKLNKNYLNVNPINELQNSDCKLIFYLIYNFNKLLDYNEKNIAVTSELAHLIIKIIKYLFNMYYTPYSDYNVRKFDFLLINELPYIDETLRVVGHYQELLTKQEIDDTANDRKDKEYTKKEEETAIDLDDYELNDDIDEGAEANDGDNYTNGDE